MAPTKTFMKSNVHFKAALIISMLLIFILGIFLFRYITYYIYTYLDLRIHLSYLIKCVDINFFPFPFLYHFTVYLFAGFSTNEKLLYESSFIVLSLALTAKYVLTVRLFHNLSRNNLYNYLSIFICIGLLLCSPISWSINKMYLGKTNINVWHNPTTIMVMPFVILLFESIVKFLQDNKIEMASIISMIAFFLLNIVTKPSFAFVVIPALPIGIILYQEKNKGIDKKLLMGVLISFFLFLLIILSYYLVYERENYILYSQGNSKDRVAIKLFEIWILYGGYYFPLHIISGLVFPIMYCILFFSSVKEDKLLQFTILLYLIAFLISCVFIETGKRIHHGNFVWQVIMTGYLLFTVVSIRMVEKIKQFGWKDKKNKIVFATFILHFAYGILYLIKIIFMKNYF